MIEKIAYYIGRNDEEPNIDLAIELINLKDLEGIKEIGQHAESAFICIDEENSKEFVSALLKRRDNLSASQKRRVDKLIKNIEKGNFSS